MDSSSLLLNQSANITPQQPYEHAATLLLNNSRYEVVATLIEGNLALVIEESSTANRWIGSFTPAQVEEMTSKTGTTKRFEVVLRMLQSALAVTSSSVTIDLFLPEDLDLLRHRQKLVEKSHQSRLHVTESVSAKKNIENGLLRRFLVLTFSTEFDIVHYPFALRFEQNPDPTWLRSRVAEYRALYEDASGQALTLRSDVSELQSRLKRSEEDLRASENRKIEAEIKTRSLSQITTEQKAQIEALTQRGEELQTRVYNLESSIATLRQQEYLEHKKKVVSAPTTLSINYSSSPSTSLTKSTTDILSLENENEKLRREIGKLHQLLRAVSVATRVSISAKMRSRESNTELHALTKGFSSSLYTAGNNTEESYTKELITRSRQYHPDENETELRNIVENVERQRRNMKEVLSSFYSESPRENVLRQGFDTVLFQFSRLLDFSLTALKDNEDLEFRLEAVVEGIEKITELHREQ